MSEKKVIDLCNKELLASFCQQLSLVKYKQLEQNTGTTDLINLLARRCGVQSATPQQLSSAFSLHCSFKMQQDYLVLLLIPAGESWSDIDAVSRALHHRRPAAATATGAGGGEREADAVRAIPIYAFVASQQLLQANFECETRHRRLGALLCDVGEQTQNEDEVKLVVCSTLEALAEGVAPQMRDSLADAVSHELRALADLHHRLFVETLYQALARPTGAMRELLARALPVFSEESRDLALDYYTRELAAIEIDLLPLVLAHCSLLPVAAKRQFLEHYVQTALTGVSLASLNAGAPAASSITWNLRTVDTHCCSDDNLRNPLVALLSSHFKRLLGKGLLLCQVILLVLLFSFPLYSFLLFCRGHVLLRSTIASSVLRRYE